MDERPNPIVKHATDSSLPRTARARVGQTTDPVPEGKALDTESKHHFATPPASHDVERSHPKPPSELGLPERDAAMKEMHKMQQEEGRLGLRDKGGMDWMGAATSTNKKMESRHKHADLNIGKSKHLDTVRHNK